jgi:hypothetical protein
MAATSELTLTGAAPAPSTTSHHCSPLGAVESSGQVAALAAPAAPTTSAAAAAAAARRRRAPSGGGAAAAAAARDATGARAQACSCIASQW